MPCFRAGLTKPPGLFGLGTLILAVLVIGVAASGLALISSSLCAVVGLRVLVGLSAIHLEMVCLLVSGTFELLLLYGLWAIWSPFLAAHRMLDPSF